MNVGADECDLCLNDCWKDLGWAPLKAPRLLSFFIPLARPPGSAGRVGPHNWHMIPWVTPLIARKGSRIWTHTLNKIGLPFTSKSSPARVCDSLSLSPADANRKPFSKSATWCCSCSCNSWHLDSSHALGVVVVVVCTKYHIQRHRFYMSSCSILDVNHPCRCHQDVCKTSFICHSL
jgi:hypothetical protein